MIVSSDRFCVGQVSSLSRDVKRVVACEPGFSIALRQVENLSYISKNY
jgi:hypothetical protein